MKTTTIALSIATLAAAAALGTYITREHKTSTASVEVQAQSPAEMQAAASNQNSGAAPVTPGSHTPSSVARTIPGAARAEVAATRDPGSVIFDQAVRTLISSQTSFQEKQAAWGQIRSAGKFDQLISDLEQRFAAQPTVPELPATLGQAYLQKAGSIQDVREQGILGMKADQSFDAALGLDASNWEARYWKAMAMSYWPPQLGKGKEVIEHCLELLKQQEVQAPQEQFAQTYVLLGNQYQAQGESEYAMQSWKRGLGLFPSNPVLKQKVAGQQ